MNIIYPRKKERSPIDLEAPPIYTATREDGRPLRIAFYQRYKSTVIDAALSYELTLRSTQQWVKARTNWDLQGVFFDSKPDWVAYEELKNASYDLIVAKSISVFGQPLCEAYKRISDLPCPVYFVADNLLSTDDKFLFLMEALIAEEVDLHKDVITA